MERNYMIKSKYARGTFVEEIARLQQQLQNPALTKAQHKKLAARLANRMAKHNANIRSGDQIYDNYFAILQHLLAGNAANTLTSKQQYSLNYICDKFNPILSYCNITRDFTYYTNAQLIKLVRNKINTGTAVRKYKTRTKV
jgi:hypothetical protein